MLWKQREFSDRNLIQTFRVIRKNFCDEINLKLASVKVKRHPLKAGMEERQKKFRCRKQFS